MTKRKIQFSLVYRDMFQSSGKFQPRKDQLERIAPVIIKICFYSCEASHLYNNRCYAFQLILTRLKLTAALEHVAIDKTKLNLTLCHIYKCVIFY